MKLFLLGVMVALAAIVGVLAARSRPEIERYRSLSRM